MKLTKLQKANLLKNRIGRLNKFYNSKLMPEKGKDLFIQTEALLILRTFHNSDLGSIKFIFLHWLKSKWRDLEFTLWLFWHKTILRKTHDQIDELLGNL